jgi:hypothetical protein
VLPTPLRSTTTHIVLDVHEVGPPPPVPVSGSSRFDPADQVVPSLVKYVLPSSNESARQNVPAQDTENRSVRLVPLP